MTDDKSKLFLNILAESTGVISKETGTDVDDQTNTGMEADAAQMARDLEENVKITDIVDGHRTREEGEHEHDDSCNDISIEEMDSSNNDYELSLMDKSTINDGGMKLPVEGSQTYETKENHKQQEEQHD